jgi:hypothetical protein
MDALERQQWIERLREDNAATREEVEAQMAALEADPLALADFMAAQNDDFIRKMQGNDLVFKKNPDALVATAAVASPFDDPTFFDDIAYVVAELRREFQSDDRILKQRVQALEQKVAELTGQLSVLITQGNDLPISLSPRHRSNSLVAMCARQWPTERLRCLVRND